MTKQCTKCQTIKPITEFYKHKQGVDGLHPRCKICVNEHNKEYLRQNEDIVKQRRKEYWERVKNVGQQINRDYYYQHKEKMKLKAIQWRKENPDKYKAIRLKAIAKNPELYRQKQRERKRRWDKKAMLNPLHRLNNNLRGNMYHALKSFKGFRKWESLVGYTLEDLAKHLESRFVPGISWENYGTEWHVDHITPKSWFKYQSTDDPKFKECWALSNLQPKLKLDNIRKGNRFAG